MSKEGEEWRHQALDAGDRRLHMRALAAAVPRLRPHRQGLTPVHFSAQLEPCLTQEDTLHTPNTPYNPLNMGYTTLTRTPYPIQIAKVELRSGRV